MAEFEIEFALTTQHNINMVDDHTDRNKISNHNDFQQCNALMAKISSLNYKINKKNSNYDYLE